MKKLFTLMIVGTFMLNGSYAQILSEDFEGGALPTDWTIETEATDGGYAFGNAAAQSSSAYSFPAHTTFAATNDDACNCNKLVDRLISPELVLASTEGVLALSFDWSFANLDYDADERVRIYILSGGSETEIAELDGEGSGDWNTFGYNLDAYNNSTIQIIFDYTDGGGWNYAFGVDDVLVENVTGTEASMVSVDNYMYAEAGDQAVEFTVSNSGAEDITSFDVTWDIDGTETTESFASSIGFGGTQSFTTTGTFAVDIDVAYDVTVTLTSVNGSADNIGNANAMTMVSGVGYFADRVIVIEEATGTWCGWCPRGTVFMEQMADDFPNTTFLAAVHNGDPMVVTAYDNGIGNYIPGYPSGLVDRSYGAVDPSNFPDFYEVAMGVPSVFDLTGSSVSYNPTTGDMTINVDCKTSTTLSGNYRLNVVITEDGVTGTSSSWNQANYYSGGGSGDMGGFEDLANPVPAADMVYDHVARAILGGWNGTSGSLPGDLDYNVVNEYEFVWNVPSDYDVANMHVGVMVINQTTDQIENAYSIHEVTVGINEISSLTSFNVYPNPANDVAHIAFNLVDSKNVRVEVIDLLGKVVYQEEMGQLSSGTQLIDIDASSLRNGMYIFNIYVGNERISERVSISK